MPGYEAPVYISWGRTNRSALIRIPRITTGPHIAARAASCAARTPAANPYLAFAVMLAAGLDGIEKQTGSRRTPAEEDLYHVDGTRAGLETLPGDLGDAIEALEARRGHPGRAGPACLRALRRSQDAGVE